MFVVYAIFCLRNVDILYTCTYTLLKAVCVALFAGTKSEIRLTLFSLANAVDITAFFLADNFQVHCICKICINLTNNRRPLHLVNVDIYSFSIVFSCGNLYSFILGQRSQCNWMYYFNCWNDLFLFQATSVWVAIIIN